MSTDRGGIDQIAFRGEGGWDQTEDFWREAVDGNETVLKVSRGHPYPSSSRRYFANLEVLRVKPLACGDEGLNYTSSSLKRKVSGLDTIERVNCSAFAAPSTGIDNTLSKALSAGLELLPEREAVGVW